MRILGSNRNTPTEHRQSYRSRRGMTLLEISIAMPIVLVALGMLVQILAVGTGLRRTNREGRVANAAAQDVLEQVRNQEFSEVIRLYNADPFDDPLGPGTAPGNTFAVSGLPALNPDAGVPVGEIILPTTNTGTEVVPVWEVREDLQLANLSLPRDLNGDVIINAEDRSDDYTIVPALVRVRWRGANGPRTYDLRTLFTELRF